MSYEMRSGRPVNGHATFYKAYVPPVHQPVWPSGPANYGGGGGGSTGGGGLTSSVWKRAYAPAYRFFCCGGVCGGTAKCPSEFWKPLLGTLVLPLYTVLLTVLLICAGIVFVCLGFCVLVVLAFLVLFCGSLIGFPLVFCGWAYVLIFCVCGCFYTSKKRCMWKIGRSCLVFLCFPRWIFQAVKTKWSNCSSLRRIRKIRMRRERELEEQQRRKREEEGEGKEGVVVAVDSDTNAAIATPPTFGQDFKPKPVKDCCIPYTVYHCFLDCCHVGVGTKDEVIERRWQGDVPASEDA